MSTKHFESAAQFCKKNSPAPVLPGYKAGGLPYTSAYAKQFLAKLSNSDFASMKYCTLSIIITCISGSKCTKMIIVKYKIINPMHRYMCNQEVPDLSSIDC